MRAFLLSLVCLVLCSACGESASTTLWKTSTLNAAKERGKLIVALEASFKPFEYIDEKGEMVGFDIDLARIIADEMNIDVEFQNVNWDGIIPSITTRRADLIISGMTATPERALKVSFSEPYFHTITCFLVSKKRAGDAKGLDDLNQAGRIITVKTGTTGQTAAEKRLPNATIKKFEQETDAALEVAFGRADAFLFDLRAVENHHEKHPDTTFILRKPVSVEPYAIAFRKGDPDTAAWLNLLIHHMRRDGRLKELYAKYRLQNVEPDR